MKKKIFAYIASLLSIVIVAGWLVSYLGGTGQPAPRNLANTGNSVRILTFNTYLLSPIFMCKWDPLCHLFDANFEDRAKQIGAAITMTNQKFDIVAFNEVWDEDTKDVLEHTLGSIYPNYVKYISKSGPDLIQLKKDWGFLGGDFEDSGLMLFSKFPFQKLPFVKDDYEASDYKPFWIKKQLAFKEFHDCAFAIEDCRAAKGAALIQVKLPSTRLLDVVFAHTQADSGSSTHADVREKQLADVQDVLETTMGKSFTSWTNDEWLVALGDLNINGLGGGSARYSDYRQIFWPTPPRNGSIVSRHRRRPAIHPYMTAGPKPPRPKTGVALVMSPKNVSTTSSPVGRLSHPTPGPSPIFLVAVASSIFGIPRNWRK